MKAVSHIIKTEGLTALWKGHVAAQALSISFGTVQFTMFQSLVDIGVKLAPNWNSTQPVINFSSGFLAGCCATVVSFPFDTVRTRLVVQGEPKVIYL